MAVTRTARRDPGTTPQQRYLRAVEVGTARSAAAAVPKFGVGPKRQELLFAQSVLLETNQPVTRHARRMEAHLHLHVLRGRSKCAGEFLREPCVGRLR